MAGKPYGNAGRLTNGRWSVLVIRSARVDKMVIIVHSTVPCARRGSGCAGLGLEPMWSLHPDVELSSDEKTAIVALGPVAGSGPLFGRGGEGAAADGRAGHRGRAEGCAGLPGVDRHAQRLHQRRDPPAGEGLPADQELQGRRRRAAPAQLLFQIDPREFQARSIRRRASSRKAQAALGKTQLDVARYTPLAKEGAVSQQELDNAVQENLANMAAVDAAKAAVEQAQLNLGWTKVTSPIDGVAGIAIAQIGDLVEPSDGADHRLAARSDQGRSSRSASRSTCAMRARRPSARRAGDARKGALELILADGTVYPAPRHGRRSIGRQVDPRTGTLHDRGAVPQPRATSCARAATPRCAR